MSHQLLIAIIVGVMALLIVVDSIAYRVALACVRESKDLPKWYHELWFIGGGIIYLYSK